MENGYDNSESGTVATDTENVDGENDPASPQPAAEPEDPTSTGDIDYSAGLAEDNAEAGVNSEPQIIARDDA